MRKNTKVGLEIIFTIVLVALIGYFVVNPIISPHLINSDMTVAAIDSQIKVTSALCIFMEILGIALILILRKKENAKYLVKKYFVIAMVIIVAGIILFLISNNPNVHKETVIYTKITIRDLLLTALLLAVAGDTGSRALQAFRSL